MQLQITSSVGITYNVLSRKDDVYRVADAKTNQFVGFIGYACYKGVCTSGPLTLSERMAQARARQCAYNRYQARVKMAAHSKTH